MSASCHPNLVRRKDRDAITGLDADVHQTGSDLFDRFAVGLPRDRLPSVIGMEPQGRSVRRAMDTIPEACRRSWTRARPGRVRYDERATLSSRLSFHQSLASGSAASVSSSTRVSKSGPVSCRSAV